MPWRQHWTSVGNYSNRRNSGELVVLLILASDWHIYSYVNPTLFVFFSKNILSLEFTLHFLQYLFYRIYIFDQNLLSKHQYSLITRCVSPYKLPLVKNERSRFNLRYMIPSITNKYSLNKFVELPKVSFKRRLKSYIMESACKNGWYFFFILYFMISLTPLTPPEILSLKILFFIFCIDKIVVHFLFVLYQWGLLNFFLYVLPSSRACLSIWASWRFWWIWIFE